MKRQWNTKKVAIWTLVIAMVLEVILNPYLLVRLGNAISVGDVAVAIQAILVIFLFGVFWAAIASAICAIRNRIVSKSTNPN
jgi:hypothetical protein